MAMKSIIFVLPICNLWQIVQSEYMIFSGTETVNGDSYKYLELKEQGQFRIELHSVAGDADLYISDLTDRPDYVEYEMKSDTCGEDILYIPPSMSRPVSIGVFGHPSYEQSTFSLQVYFEDVSDDPFQDTTYTYEQFEYEDESKYSKSKNKPGTSSTGAKKPSMPKDEEESVLWQIFVGILKIFFEILV